ncbi:hypothetical protein AVEN_220064-1 [Araneus ventricosus]|uniref:Uncharacterized protein n=1 Tax=Araneus ventricosus TaxID=182803 RepID=A0A4Y2HLV0_ARAVE|nr:hypothetical protein AVEN_220064-1 [Araneus ventricosus]
MFLVVGVYIQDPYCAPIGRRHKALKQVIWGTKRVHPHKHAQFRDAEVHRSGIDECECSNEGMPRPVERQNPFNRQPVAEIATTGPCCINDHWQDDATKCVERVRLPPVRETLGARVEHL